MQLYDLAYKGIPKTTTTNASASTITSPVLFIQNLVHMLCDDVDEAHFADRFGTTIMVPLSNARE